MGKLVYDSGDALEQVLAKQLPERFNIDSDGKGKVDDRSAEKGPEPEGVVVGRVGDSTYALCRPGADERDRGVRRDAAAIARSCSTSCRWR